MYKRTNKDARVANSKYWKTFNGKLMLTYNNMTRRITGYVKPHLYEGLSICSREDFYTWSKNSDVFSDLYKGWVKSGFERRLSPSIDRVNVNNGYTLDNIQWITHSENSRKGSNTRWSKLEDNKIII